MFPKMEPLRLQILGSLENENKTQLFYTYLSAWNKHDGIMPGLALYNGLIPMKKAEYLLAPMFGLKSKTLTGGLKFTYSINAFPKDFQVIRFKLNASRFSYGPC